MGREVEAVGVGDVKSMGAVGDVGWGVTWRNVTSGGSRWY